MPQHGSYLVDSLWEAAGDMLQDWTCMTDLLLDDTTEKDDEGIGLFFKLLYLCIY